MMMDTEEGGSQGSGKKKLGSFAAKAGLQFPVRKFARLIVSQKYATHQTYRAPIFLSAVLQYIAAEVLELAGNAARDDNSNQISPKNIHSVVRNDEELSKLLGQVLDLPENAPGDDYEKLSAMLGQVTI